MERDPRHRDLACLYGRGRRGPLRVMVGVMLALALACGADAVEVPGGDPDRGIAAIRAEGCQMCHTIPGVGEAEGSGAPSLERWARRSEIAGAVPNEPDHLIAWLIDPHALSTETAMRPLGIAEADARDIAAYLYTLR